MDGQQKAPRSGEGGAGERGMPNYLLGSLFLRFIGESLLLILIYFGITKRKI